METLCFLGFNKGDLDSKFIPKGCGLETTAGVYINSRGLFLGDGYALVPNFVRPLVSVLLRS